MPIRSDALKTRFNKNRVVLAMSGGVDSSVGAYLLKKNGFEVIGVTLKTWQGQDCAGQGFNRCCSLRDIDDARAVAAKMNLPHYVMDFSSPFKKKVIEYFVAEYLRGRTPNPCIICNAEIKFGLLLDKAKDLGAAYIASGHYAKKAYDKASGRFFIQEAVDDHKDQSYVLFDLSQKQLSRLLLPIGDLQKQQVRIIAKKIGLRVSDKPDSQEICFVRGSYGEFVRQMIPERLPGPGRFVDENGKYLGSHAGYHLFTVGQRKGIGLTAPRPYYVLRILPKENQVVIGFEEQLSLRTMKVTKLNWLMKPEGGTYEVKIRSRHNKARAKVLRLTKTEIVVCFNQPQKAVAPGQAAVFYDGSKVVGGGWIEKAWN